MSTAVPQYSYVFKWQNIAGSKNFFSLTTIFKLEEKSYIEYVVFFLLVLCDLLFPLRLNLEVSSMPHKVPESSIKSKLIH